MESVSLTIRCQGFIVIENRTGGTISCLLVIRRRLFVGFLSCLLWYNEVGGKMKHVKRQE